MNLQERMKKYAASFKDEAHCYTDNEMALYSDLQATVRSLEAAEQMLRDIVRLSNDIVSIQIANIILDRINQTLGKAGV
jgi:hypothetical protein